MNLDKPSSVTKRAIDTLFLFNPLATAIGVLIGVALDGLRGAMQPAFQTIQSTVDFSKVRVWHLVALAIALVNIPSFISGRRELPKEVEDAFEAIHRLKHKVPETHLKLQYINLCAAVVAKVEVDRPQVKPPALHV